MTAITGVEYITLGGNRFQVREGRFTRAHLVTNLEQITASRAESPFIDAVVTGFGAGIKPEPMSDTADWAAAAAGMEPYGGPDPNAPFSQLRIGKALAAAYSAAGAGTLLPLVADHGYAFAGEQGSDKVLNSTDGVTWTAVSTGSGSTAGVAALLARHVAGPTGGSGPFRRVWASFYDNEKVYRSDDHGATWTLELDFQNGTGALPSGGSGGTIAGVADAITQLIHFQNVGLVYAVGENYGDDYGQAAIAQATSTGDVSAGIVGWLEEPYCRAGVMSTNDVMWLAGADITDPLFCSLYTLDLAVALGEPQKVVTLKGNYFTSATEHAGDTYWGGAVRGEVYRCDGSSLELFYTLPTTMPIRGLASLRGNLYVSIYSTLGRLEVWRWDGTAWSQPHYAAATLTDTGQMVEFDGRLHIAAGDGTTRKVYAVSATDNHAVARVVLPDADFAAPADAKRYRALVLRHGPLQAGQGVEALYSLDGGAYVSLGTNWRIGSTRTRFALPESAVGGRLSAWFSFTNLAALDLIAYGGKVQALPAPDARETWDAELILAPRAGHQWSDATADTLDAIQKWDILAALHDRCAVFEAIDPFRDAGGLPRRAMLGTLDIQGELSADFSTLLVEGAQAGVRVKVLQAAQPENLLTNGSFERDAAGAHPTGWLLSGTVTDWATVADGTAPDGARALAIRYDGLAATPSVYAGATVIPGRWYTLSGWLRRAAFAGAGALAYLRVSEGGVQLAGANTPHLGPGTDAWTRYSVTFAVPTSSGGTVAVEVFAGGTPSAGGAGQLIADAIQLEAGSPATPYRERGA